MMSYKKSEAIKRSKIINLKKNKEDNNKKKVIQYCK